MEEEDHRAEEELQEGPVVVALVVVEEVEVLAGVVAAQGVEVALLKEVEVPFLTAMEKAEAGAMVVERGQDP